jgi:hypothetical protein
MAKTRTFEVHALGPTGSGKTVFMASLFKSLSIKQPALPFFLRSPDHSTVVHLTRTYNAIANPDELWPPGTQSPMEWRFIACMQTAARDFEPVEYRYVDYPGGWLTDPRAQEDERIQPLVKRLTNANALLVLLDGQAVLALLRNERSGERYLEFDLASSLNIVQQSRCPVHFVITKWDLLEGTYTLQDARERLMQDQDFANLIKAKAEAMKASIRLFPVSAVGPGFAEPQSDGTMKKTGGHLQPLNVHLPLVSVLPDTLAFVYNELLARRAPVAVWAERVRKALQQADSGKAEVAVTALLKLLSKKIPMAGKLSPVLTPFVRDAVKYMIRLVEDVEERQVGKVQSDQEAFEELSRELTRISTEFERASPASVLAGGSLRGGTP